jgi:hypothetical protein
VRFLSRDWLAAVDQALAASPEVAAAVRETSLRLRQVVTGGPDGDVTYLVVVEGGRARVVPGEAAEAPGPPADVTFTSGWATAVAIATGRLAVLDAFTAGELVVRGDIDLLRTQAPALADLDAAFAQVRAATTY